MVNFQRLIIPVQWMPTSEHIWWMKKGNLRSCSNGGEKNPETIFWSFCFVFSGGRTYFVWHIVVLFQVGGPPSHPWDFSPPPSLCHLSPSHLHYHQDQGFGYHSIFSGKNRIANQTECQGVYHNHIFGILYFINCMKLSINDVYWRYTECWWYTHEGH